MRRIGWITPGVWLVLGAACLVFGSADPLEKEAPPSSTDDSGALISPVWVTASAGQGQVDLSWETVPGAIGYILWRSEDSGRSFATIRSVSETTSVDDPGPGLFCYRVSALDPEFNASGFSRLECLEVPVSPAPSP